MLDSMLRPVKDRVLHPLATTPLVRVPPTLISVVGLVLSLAAAYGASQRWLIFSVACWLAGRLADGVDGLIARSSGRASALGGMLDFVFDTIGYAAIPIGVAIGIGDQRAWIATAVVLASFYVNAVTLGHVAALIEQRGLADPDGPTSVVLPRGLVEGTETIVFFTVALVAGAGAPVVWWIMAVAVFLTAFERVRWAATWLR